jgi:uncharacterized protein (TIGR03086 family)
MSQNLRLYTSILFGFEHVLRSVPAERWDDPSPCEGWSAREVAGHAMAVVNIVAARGGVGEEHDVFADLAAFAGDDPAESFRPIRNRYLMATDRQGALKRPVKSSTGSGTLDTFIGRMTTDTLVHTWDIARATGVDERLDPDAVAAVYATLTSRDEDLARGPGRYGAAVDSTNATSHQDRLLTYTGRRP